MPKAPKAPKNPWTVQLSATVPLPRGPAFSTVVDELREALGRLGLAFVAGPKGDVTELGMRVGIVEAWTPKERVRLAWHPTNWDPTAVARVELRFEEQGSGTRVTLDYQG